MIEKKGIPWCVKQVDRGQGLWPVSLLTNANCGNKSSDLFGE